MKKLLLFSWDGGAVLDTADLHASTSKGSEGRLGSRSRGLGPVSTGSSQLDVQGGDAKGLYLLSNILGGQHSSVGRSLVSVGFDLHATGDPADGLAARQVGHVDESIVKRSEDVGNAEDELTISDLRSQGDLNLPM